MSISVVEETESTQEDLLAAVQQDATAWPHLSGLRAKIQNSGRGRGEREWKTGTLNALTVSYVLRPGAATEEWATLALRAGVAVVRALATYGIDTSIKWPNDVVIKSESDSPGWHGIAKVGGILGTLVRDSEGEYACVLGIGLNLNGEIDVPGAAALGTSLDAGKLAEEIQRELAEVAPQSSGQFAPLSELVSQHCHTLGKAVQVFFPDDDPPREVRGNAVRIDHDGALVVATGVEEVRILNGDIAHTRLQPQ